MGVDEATVTRWMRELRLAGWVTSHRRLRGSQHDLHDGNERTDAPSHRRKNAPMHRRKNAPYELPLFPEESESYPPKCAHEPDVVVNQIYKEHATHAADDKLRTVVEPVQKSAAAAAAAGDAGASTPVEANATTVEAEALVADLIPNHPEPGNPGRAATEARTVLAASADPAATAKTIRANHGSWREHWATLPRDRFIPQLWRWLNSGEWKYAPVERKGIARETWQERRRREGADDQDRYYRMLAEHGMWDALREYGQDPEVWRAKTA
jgi:hypothetical protein